MRNSDWSMQVLWGLVACVLFGTTLGLFMAVSYPFGGGELHAIFAYPDGGNPAKALRVYGEYVGVTTALCAILILVRYPLRWTILANIATFLTGLCWLKVCLFPYQSVPFRRMCIFSLLFVPIIIIPAAYGSHRLQQFLWRRLGETVRKVLL